MQDFEFEAELTFQGLLEPKNGTGIMCWDELQETKHFQLARKLLTTQLADLRHEIVRDMVNGKAVADTLEDTLLCAVTNISAHPSYLGTGIKEAVLRQALAQADLDCEVFYTGEAGRDAYQDTITNVGVEIEGIIFHADELNSADAQMLTRMAESHWDDRGFELYQSAAAENYA